MKFVLKHVFSNVSKMKEQEIQKSGEVSHAGVKWSLSIQRTVYYCYFYVHCHTNKDDDWFIDSSVKFQLVSSGVIRQEETHASTFKNNYFMKSIETPRSIMKPFLVDDQIVLQCHVDINDASGIPMGKLKVFDESTKELSDVILAVGEEKFHVSKMMLANLSSYFKSLFLGGFEESGKKIIELKNVDPSHFQVYLEAIYGEPAICDLTVEKTLELAEMYDSPVVTRTCEAHLMTSSCQLSKREKIRLSGRFKLKNLLQTTVDSSNSIQEIRSLLPADMDELDPIVAKAMFQRVLEVEANK